MTNATAVSFGFPETLVAETSSWLVLVRPKQPTFGALVLICKEQADAFSGLSAAAFADLGVAVGAVETLLRKILGYEKINYLMLMMVDPDVHLHVIPRYAAARRFGGQEFADAGWPGPPQLDAAVSPDAAATEALLATLREAWLRHASS